MKPLNESAISELKLAVGLLVRRIRAASPSSLSELSWTQKSVLNRLEKDGPSTTADLARAEGVKPQSMGTAIASLEDLGVIERKAHATDGRQFIITLTAKGAAMRKSSKDASLAWLKQAVSKLDRKEQATLFEAGKIIRRMAELE